MKYFVKTFGCQANVADSERINSMLQARGMEPAQSIDKADQIVINTCIVRESAENRIYGFVNNLEKLKIPKPKIIVTGCLVGLAVRDKTGKIMKRLREKMPTVDEFLPIEEAGFDFSPVRSDRKHALVPISNGCNHCCSYCVVPYTRGREVSRPFHEIVAECQDVIKKGYTEVTFLGQNVNSYGKDIVQNSKLKNSRPENSFHRLLETVAKLGFNKVNFISSNPWDFSNELIKVIAENSNISREIHLPVQSGSNEILEKMNRRYTREQYLNLVAEISRKVKGVQFTTDIIVGFPGETDEQFLNTIDLAEKVGFKKAYLAKYSPRPNTVSAKMYPDNVQHKEKKRRWEILEKLIN
ncbi:MiaB/RimO family radical SAM methylthiotransferase [Patescibacteria group bacterium]|nr:MiaB/RimO family radical SAM methylthiotransferase [Patescibacteria group bacterium]